MESKFNRIFITGASGTGKTTLGKKIEEVYKMPFISTSAKDVWPMFGFKDHKSAHRHSCYDPRVGNQYQHEVFRRRVQALEGKQTFVSDRSPFDNYAYYLMQIGYLNESFDNQVFRKHCENSLYLADALIFIRYPEKLELEDDGFRIVNPDYQRMVDAVINLAVKKYLKHDIPVFEIDTWDFEDRLELVKDFIGRA